MVSLLTTKPYTPPSAAWEVRFCLDLLGVPYVEADRCGLLNVFLFGQSVPYLVDRHSCSRIGNSDDTRPGTTRTELVPACRFFLLLFFFAK